MKAHLLWRNKKQNLDRQSQAYPRIVSMSPTIFVSFRIFKITIKMIKFSSLAMNLIFAMNFLSPCSTDPTIGVNDFVVIFVFVGHKAVDWITHILKIKRLFSLRSERLDNCFAFSNDTVEAEKYCTLIF